MNPPLGISYTQVSLIKNKLMDIIENILLDAPNIEARKKYRKVREVSEFINSYILPPMQREASKRHKPLITAEIVNEAKHSQEGAKVRDVGDLLAFSGRKVTLNRQKFLAWFKSTTHGATIMRERNNYRGNGVLEIRAEQDPE